MQKPVLFVSGLGRTIERSENLNCLYQSYAGEKRFASIYDKDYNDLISSGKYEVQVIDVFPDKPFTGKTIMLWHAIQGGKHIGLDERLTYYRKEFANYIDYIIAAGHGAVPMFQLCTGVTQDRILPLGMPRTDRYIGKHKGDGHTVLVKKRAYLYAPTYRTKYEPKMFEVDWQYIDSQLTDDELLVIKPHPFTHILGIGENYKHIIEVNGLEPSVNYLYDADVIITDYSSIIFDGYLLGKPAVLFEKKPGYTVFRGMYMQYPDKYCSNYATTEQDLISAIRIAYDYGLTYTERTCRNFVADNCDGHSCERICDLITRLNDGAYALGFDPVRTKPDEKIVCYFSTRNLYNVLPAAYNSLLAYNPDVHVYCFIEDDTLPYPVPEQVTCVNVSGQTMFPPYGPNYKTSFTYMVLLKAALAKIFPDADRCLILDVDTIVYDTIDPLWHYDLSHAYYAAVLEPGLTNRRGVPYANFGIVLMNLTRLRSSGKDNLVINELNENYHRLPEQDAFSLICGNKFDPLPNEYNSTVNGITGAAEHVRIRHFAGIRDWFDFDDVKYWTEHTTPPES